MTIVYGWYHKNVYDRIPCRMEVFFVRYDHQAAGMVIRRLRKERGWTQEVMSGFADLARSHLAMIERGQKKAEVDTLWKIAEALEIRPCELCRLVEEEIMKRESEHE